MFGKKNTETLVVGAGPIGMLCSLFLVKAGKDVILVDSAPSVCTSSNAAILHPDSLQILNRFGIAKRVIDAAYRINEVDIYDGSVNRATFRLNELSNPYPYAVSLAQSELENILEDELKKAGVKILWNHRVSGYEEEDDEIVAQVDRYAERGMGYAISHMERVIVKTLKIRAKTVIAADGYNSILRRIAGLESVPLGDPQCFACFEFETDNDGLHRLQISFRNGLATAQCPLSPGFARLQFQLDSEHFPDRYRDKERDFIQDKSEFPKLLLDESFRKMQKERVPWETGYIVRIRYRAAIPFNKRYLPKSHVGKLFFLGDSARSFDPLGSLSLNLGFREAERLSDILAETDSLPTVRDGELNHFSDELANEWNRYAQLKGVTHPEEMADSWIANNCGSIVRALPATDRTLQQLAEQAFIHINLEKAALA